MTGTAHEIVVHDDAGSLAAHVAGRLFERLLELQSAGRVPRVVLTGGGTGIAVLEVLRDLQNRDDVDWSRIEFYWGDERYLPPGDEERNEQQAWDALLSHVGVDPARVFPMGAEGDGSPEDAADAYARLLAERGGAGTDSAGGAAVPAFDVLLLGMGGEGHTASLFPGTQAVRETERTVVAVRGCPKPPPVRISLTLPAIRAAREVWVVTAGEAKADAVARALGGASEVDIPVAGVRGTERTLWLLDRAAASLLPS